MLTLNDLIGLEVRRIKYVHQVDKKQQLQFFYSYLKLENNYIIPFPSYPNQTFNFSKKKLIPFFWAKKPTKNCRRLIEGQKIKNFYFQYLENRHFEDSSGIIELENGSFVTEINCAPFGLRADLNIMSSSEFFEMVNDEEEIEYRKLFT